MSIQHTVVFRLIHPSGSTDEEHFLTDARAALTSIPGVEEFTINQQVSDKSDLKWQFSMRFGSQLDYDAYNDHPTHVAFVEQRWVPEVDEFQEYDFVTR